MKHAFILALLLLFCFCPFGAPARSAQSRPPGAQRFFYSGDGRIDLVSAKSGATFKGRYRLADGTYDQSAIKRIYRTFGADKELPLSAISLRLIEFLDFLQDRLSPGAQLTIVSGWRSPEYNTGLRNKGALAAKASLHQYGMATDLKMAGVPSERIWNYVKQLGFGGTGYYHGELVHIDVGPARSWDETTSGVGTDISNDNKLIGVVTDFDSYRPADTLSLRFIRMTALPIGVNPLFALDRIGDAGGLTRIDSFKPVFRGHAAGTCPRFSDIGQMMAIELKLPKDLPPGKYRITASFCESEWKDMPAQVTTPEFEIISR